MESPFVYVLCQALCAYYSDKMDTLIIPIFEMRKLERLTHLHEVTQLVNHRAKDLSSASYDSRPSVLHALSKEPEAHCSITIPADRVGKR